MLDVRLDLNDGLLMFCQAFFYENLYECKSSYEPSFGDSLTDLLLKINAARADSLLIDGPVASTASRTVVIQDNDHDPACNDAKACPINYFRNHGSLLYEVDPVYQQQFMDMMKQTGRDEICVGWYHSHPGWGCWLSGTDMETQKSQEMLNAKAVGVVVDPVQSVKGKVVIDAFRSIDPATAM